MGGVLCSVSDVCIVRVVYACCVSAVWSRCVSVVRVLCECCVCGV